MPVLRKRLTSECIEAPGLSAARETHRRDDGDDADERRESAKERGTPTKLYGFV